jgi:hypothetical protein
MKSNIRESVGRIYDLGHEGGIQKDEIVLPLKLQKNRKGKGAEVAAKTRKSRKGRI